MKTDPKKSPEDICICGKPYRTHTPCEACDIRCASFCEFQLQEYKGYHLCASCRHRWEKMEKQVGREVSWGEMLYGLRFVEGDVVRN